MDSAVGDIVDLLQRKKGGLDTQMDMSKGEGAAAAGPSGSTRGSSTGNTGSDSTDSSGNSGSSSSMWDNTLVVFQTDNGGLVHRKS